MKKHRKLLTIVSIAFLATLVSCDIIPGSTFTSPSSTTLTGDDLSSFLESLSSSSSSPALTIQGGENRLAIGEKRQLRALLDGVETTEVTWWSQSPDVCTIDENGLVEAIREGVSIIFAETVVKGNVVQAEITIEVYTGSFEIDEEQVYLYVGEAYDLKFSIDPIEFQDSLNWTSGNESVVTVDQSGRLVATGIGETRVDAVSKIYHDTCYVYVRDPLSEGLEYRMKPDGTYEIASYTSPNENVVIPEYYNGIPVTSIASYAFGYSNLKSLSIPSTIKEIGDRAFYFSQLETVYISEGVREIGFGAFENCSSLKEVTLPDSLLTIPDFAFFMCSALSSIRLPSSLTSIGMDAFYSCSSLKGIRIPQSLNRIEEQAFYMAGLTSVYIPKNVQIIGPYAFDSSNAKIFCEAKSRPSGWSSTWAGHVEDKVYFDCPEEGFRTIGDFVYVLRDEEGENPSAVILEYIGEEMDVSIPETVTDGEVLYPVQEILPYAFYQKKSIQTIQFPQGLKTIGNSAFTSCENLRFLSFPSSLREIGNNAFSYCTSLISVTMRMGLRRLGEDAFSNCENLRNVVVPGSIEEMNQAFFDCRKIDHIFCLSGEKKENWPGDWDSWWSVDEKNDVLYATDRIVEEGGVFYAIKEEEEGKTAYAFRCTDDEKDITIPESILDDGESVDVTGIGEYAFSALHNTQSVLLSQKITRILHHAFYLSGIPVLFIPDSVEAIGEYALNSIDLYIESASPKPGWEEHWEGNREYEMVQPDRSITWNYRPIAIVEQDDLRFYLLEEEGKKTATVAQYLGEGGNVSVPESISYDGEEYEVASIGKSAFYGRDITTIDLPENLLSIEPYAFYSCTSLQSIVLPKKLQSIGEFAFGFCTMPAIQIPLSVERIERYAFSCCYSTTCYYEGEKAPTTWEENWDQDVSQTMVLHFIYGCDSAAIRTVGDYDIVVQEKDGSKGIAIVRYHGDSETLVLPTSFEVDGEEIPVTAIMDFAFEGHEELKWLDISAASIRKVGNYAFYGCTNLTNVFLSGEIEAIGKNAFLDCPQATLFVPWQERPSQWDPLFAGDSRVIEDYSPLSFVEVDGALYAIFEDGTAELFLAPLEKSSFTIPETVSYGGAEVTVTSIAEGAFAYRRQMENVVLPDTIVSIGEDAFRECGALKQLVLGKNVVEIGANAFSGCGNIVLLAEVQEIPGAWSDSFNPDSRPLVLGYEGIVGESDGYRYAVSIDGEGRRYITILSYEGEERELVLPETFDVDGQGLPVRHLASHAFAGSEIHSIRLPDSLLSIGDYCFYMSSLQTIRFGQNLMSIGQSAFASSSLRYACLPNSLVFLGQDSFASCQDLIVLSCPDTIDIYPAISHSSPTVLNVDSYLDFLVIDGCLYGILGEESPTSAALIHVPESWTELVVPESIEYDGQALMLTKIAKEACQNGGVRKVVLPSGLKSIDEYAFSNCTALEEINLPETILHLGEGAFSRCSSLTEIALPSGLTEISNGLFAESGLRFLEIPYGVKTIGDGAICCPQLQSVSLPETLETLGWAAFRACSLLSEIHLPSSLRTIESEAFRGCTSLRTIFLPQTIQTIENDVFYEVGDVYIFTDAPSLPSGWNLNFYSTIVFQVSSIPEIVTIDDFTYYLYQGNGENIAGILEYSGNSSSIVLPEIVSFDGIDYTLVEIGATVFREHSEIQSIQLPDSIRSVGIAAFEFCTSLESIVLPEAITRLPDNVFYYCQALTTVVLPKGLIEVGSHAFNECRSLKDIQLPAGLTVIPNNLFFGCSALEEITIPAGVTEIGVNAFKGTNLKEVIIPDSVTTIGNGAFQNCLSLSSVTLGQQVRTIGVLAFAETNIRSVFLSDGLQSIGEMAFYETPLEIVYLSKSVVSVGENAFPGYSWTCRIFTDADERASGWTGVFDDIFYSVPRPDSFVFYEGAYYGLYDGEGDSYATLFFNASLIPEIVVPDSIDDHGRTYPVREIAARAFESKTQENDVITSIHLPESVERIGDYAFMGCRALTYLILPANLSSLGYCCFFNCSSLSFLVLPTNDIEGLEIENDLFANMNWPLIYVLEKVDRPENDYVTYVGLPREFEVVQVENYYLALCQDEEGNSYFIFLGDSESQGILPELPETISYQGEELPLVVLVE